MPAVSIEKWIARELELCKPSVRYTDVALQLRRLTVEPVPGGCLTRGQLLYSADGVEWRIPMRSCDRALPISTSDLAKASSYGDGELLYPTRPGSAPAAPAGRLCVEVLIDAGGSWDNVRKTWRLDSAGRRMPATMPLRFQIRESQVEFTRWLARVLDCYRRGVSPPQQGALAYGLTRSGKTVICLLCLISLAIDMPRVKGKQTIIILVSVDHPTRKELDRELREVLPKRLWTYREDACGKSPAHTYTLENGAQITHMTAEDPESLRSAGMITAALFNEAGKMAELAFRNGLNKLKDQDGVALLASNRPQRTKANYVARLAKDAEADVAAGLVPDFAFFRLNPELNDFLSDSARDRIGRILERLTPGQDDLEGAILEVGDFCYNPPWDDNIHVRPIPEGLPDITRRVTRMIGGVEKDYILGADFQAHPAMAGTAWKVLGELPDKWILWCVRAFWIENADEDDLADDFEDVGFTAANSLIIADASGNTQGAQRAYGARKAGPTSFSYFKARRYNIIGPQKRKTAATDRNTEGANPRPKEVAVARVNGLLRELRAGGFRALMVSDNPEAKPMAISFAKCKATRGRYGVVPGGEHSHLTDTALYICWATLTALRPGEVRQRQKERAPSAPRFDPNNRPEVQ